MRQFDEADNMTDRQGALGVLANSDGARARRRRWPPSTSAIADNALVLDKWFTTQALSTRDDTLGGGRGAAPRIPISRSANPNRLRSLVGAFAANQRAFHDASGRGYRFLADMILAVDKLNPQTAAKLVPPLGRWRRFGEDRAALMRAELERIVGDAGAQQGRVRAGLEEPRLRIYCATQAATCSATWLAAWLSAGATARRVAAATGTRASKRLVVTPPALPRAIAAS